MNKLAYSLAIATALVATSCSQEEIINNTETPSTPGTKEMIQFSMSDGTDAPVGRATSRNAFGAKTDIVMLFRSNKDNGTTAVRANKTRAYTKDHTSMTDHSDIEYDGTDRVRYWDDAFGRSAFLSVYAIGIDQKTGTGNNSQPLDKCIDGPEVGKEWTTVADATDILTTWKVATEQTSTTIDNEDLVYSNNIRQGGEYGVTWYDWTNSTWKPSTHTGTADQHGSGRMQFRIKPAEPADPTGPGYFDKGHLIFNHALTRLSVTLQEGDGFDGVKTTDADFKFTAGSNITLKGMNISGKLDMKTSSWKDKATADITSMSPAESKTHANNTFTAQMLPDYEFNDNNNTNVMEFTIDSNEYFITQDMIFDALKANSAVNKLPTDVSKYTMEQGKHYKLTITVKKKKIEDMTATIAEWSDIVAGVHEQDNTHVTFEASQSGSACSDVYFYRLAEDLGKIYTNKSYLTDTYTEGPNNGKKKGTIYQGNYGSPATTTKEGDVWKTNWYFEDNKTAYHFRTLNTSAKSTLDNTGNSFFVMTNGASGTTNYHWGAQMTTTDYKYDTKKGYEPLLLQGITSTNSRIKIQELNMMSNIKVVLQTTSGSDAVLLRKNIGTNETPLYKDATVTLTRLYGSAKVDMGIGLVTPQGDVVAETQMTQPSDYYATENTKTNAFTFSVVPQPLYRGTEDVEENYIGITITTPDDNQYYVVKKLYEIKPTAIGTSKNESTESAITRWYPNHRYTYTFTLKKKGIEDITCTVAAWQDVEATNKDITLED